jgi:hypothetical protein
VKNEEGYGVFIRKGYYLLPEKAADIRPCNNPIKTTLFIIQKPFTKVVNKDFNRIILTKTQALSVKPTRP